MTENDMTWQTLTTRVERQDFASAARNMMRAWARRIRRGAASRG